MESRLDLRIMWSKPVGSLSPECLQVLSSNYLLGILVPPFETENCFHHKTSNIYFLCNSLPTSMVFVEVLSL